MRTKRELEEYILLKTDELQKKQERLNILTNYIDGENKNLGKIAAINEFQNKMFDYIKLIDDVEFLQNTIDSFLEEANKTLDTNIARYEGSVKAELGDHLSSFKEKNRLMQERMEREKPLDLSAKKIENGIDLVDMLNKIVKEEKNVEGK